jgi:hypothetical protein
MKSIPAPWSLPNTDDALECTECPWRGYEDGAIRRDEPADDWWFACPACGGTCAHLPIDELDTEATK